MRVRGEDCRQGSHDATLEHAVVQIEFDCDRLQAMCERENAREMKN